MGTPHLEKSEPTNIQISGDTKSSAQQIVEKANEHPEWLPDGWNVDCRTRKSGTHMGSGYKCYIDPLNGYKFYSKPEVLRYLDTIKGNSCTSRKEKKCTNLDSSSNVVVVGEKSTVEDLPPGWIKEVKIRKNSKGIRKDPFYTDPVSGFVFRSKKDALRYVESGDISTCAFKPSRRQIQDEDKFIPSPAAKRQKLKHSATKPQLFVGKEISDKNSLELSDSNSLKEGQDVKVPSGMTVTSVHTVESIVKMLSLEDGTANPPEMKKASDPDDVQEKDYVGNVMKNTNEKNHIKRRISKNKEFNVHRRFSPRLAGIEPVQLANNVTNEQTLQVPNRKMRKSRTTLDADMENNLSQRFDGVPEIEHAHKMQREVITNNLSEDQANFSEESHQVETKKIEDKVAMKTIRAVLPSMGNPYNGHDLASEAHVLKENNLHPSEMGKSGSQEISTNTIKSSNKKEHRIPCRASKRLDGLEHELMSSSVSCEIAPKYKSRKSKDDFRAESQQSEVGPAMELVDHAPINGKSADNRRTPPKIPSVTNNQPEKLEVEEMNDTKAEPQLCFAFHCSWSDPYLDFATNTLTGRSRDRNPQVHSNKSKNKKELKMPRRLSKRLAGLEPEVLPSERALEYTPRKSCKNEPVAIATATLTNGASEHLDTREETRLTTCHASDSLKTGGQGESSNKSEKPYDYQTVPKEQFQKLEADDIGDERSEPQLPLPFGDTWSDPCLEFAIKTLTDSLPIDAAADIFPIMTPDDNDPPIKELHEIVADKSLNEEAYDNLNQSQNKRKLDMVCQPSKQLLGQPELRTCSTSCENYPKFAAGESYSHEVNITRSLDGKPLHIEAGNVTQLAQNSRHKNTLIHEEPVKENGQVLQGESVTAGQPQHETETINHDNSEKQFCASFMDSWSDPCLEFAFKTLTGAIPVEENLSLLGCFQDPAHCHDQRDGGSTLPDFGSSSFSQSDFSFHYDIGEKSMPRQQSSMSSPFLPLEKASLDGCTGVDPHKHYSECNKNFQGR